MILHCYRKREEINIGEIAEKIYQLCCSVNSIDSSIFSNWIIYFKRRWSFDINAISKEDFINEFVSGILEDNKSFLKRKGYEFNSKLKDAAGFQVSLFCVLGKKKFIVFGCGMGIFSDLLVNSSSISFPKDFILKRHILEVIVRVISPQWATLTDDNLVKDIAKFSVDIVPGYWMFFDKSILLPPADFINDIVYCKSDGTFLQLSKDFHFSSDARQKATFLVEYFKRNNIVFNTFLVSDLISTNS